MQEAVELTKIKKAFNDFRKGQKGKKSHALRYPENLKSMIYDAKDLGHTMSAIGRAAGVSAPGILNMLRKHSEQAAAKPVARKPEKKQVIAKSAGPASMAGKRVEQPRQVTQSKAGGEERVSLIVNTAEGEKEFSMKVKDVTKIFSWLVK